MVKPLPMRCRLTALFDVSQINDMKYEHTNEMSAVWPLGDPCVIAGQTKYTAIQITEGMLCRRRKYCLRV